MIPLFLDGPVDLHIDENDIEISSLSCEDEQPGCSSKPAVTLCHIPSSITVQSSGNNYMWQTSYTLFSSNTMCMTYSGSKSQNHIFYVKLLDNISVML